MTKSRTLPALLLPGLLSMAIPANAEVPPLATGIVDAPPDPLGDIAARQRVEEARCQRDGGDEIVVCGRPSRGGGYRIPYEPEPGARVRLVSGEAPSAIAAMSAGGCLRLCEQPLMINLLDPRSIVRGLDRILSGD